MGSEHEIGCLCSPCWDSRRRIERNPPEVEHPTIGELMAATPRSATDDEADIFCTNCGAWIDHVVFQTGQAKTYISTIISSAKQHHKRETGCFGQRWKEGEWKTVDPKTCECVIHTRNRKEGRV